MSHRVTNIASKWFYSTKRLKIKKKEAKEEKRKTLPTKC